MDTIHMFVNGQAMSGGSLNDALEGADFVGPARTAPRYQFFSVRDEFPGLHPVISGGAEILGELYALPYSMLRERLLPREPQELELTVIELSDGQGSLAMVMRQESLSAPRTTDITASGGWLSYLASRS